MQSPILIGGAKPVPFNPYNLRNQKWGPAVVGAAGPLANVSLAIVFGLTLRLLPSLTGLVPGAFLLNFMTIASTVAFLNLALAFFNLLPIPPLDGSKVLFALLPYRYMYVQTFLERYGFLVLLLFIFMFGGALQPLANAVFNMLTGF